MIGKRNERLEIDFGEDGFELGAEVVDGAVVQDEIVGDGDRAAFLDGFDFVIVTLASGLAVEGADGASGKTFVTEVARGDDGDDGELVARELLFQGFVFGPGVEAIQNDALLAGGDEVVDFGDDLAGDPIVTFFFADLFAEDFFVFWGNFDVAFGHFFEVHAAEIGFRDAVVGEIIDDDGFAGAGHADDGEKFYVAIFHELIIAYLRGAGELGVFEVVWYN